MSMGGGGGGGGYSPKQRGMEYWKSNPTASYDEVIRVANGMSPMAAAMYPEYQQLARDATRDLKTYGNQLGQAASGGLLMRGMKQVDEALSAPQVGQGAMARMMARQGVAMSPDMQANFAGQNAMSQASTEVGLRNQARSGLVDTMRGLRLGGIA